MDVENEEGGCSVADLAEISIYPRKKIVPLTEEQVDHYLNGFPELTQTSQAIAKSTEEIWETKDLELIGDLASPFIERFSRALEEKSVRFKSDLIVLLESEQK